MKNQYTRTVTYDPEIEIEYSEFLSGYINCITGRLIPNTKVMVGDNLRMQINSLGCKGEELAGNNPVIGFFGDSGSFGNALADWVRHVYIPGTQNLNASVEGHAMKAVVEQHQFLKSNVDFIAGVFYTGWHNLVYGETSEDYWRSQLDLIEGLDVIAHCTPHSCLTDDYQEKGLDLFLNDDTDRKFGFFSNLEVTMDSLEKIYINHKRYTVFLENYCQEKNRVFIDLDSFLKPKSYENIPEVYLDICHLNPIHFSNVAIHVMEIIGPRVTAALVEKSKKSREIQPPGMNKKSKKDDLGANIYPIW